MLVRSGSPTLLILSSLILTIPPAATGATAAEVVTYQTHIRQIFRDHCGSCHRGTRARGGLDLTSYGGIMQGSSSGSVITKRTPDESLIYLTMAHLEEPAMPPGKKKLDDAVIQTVKLWIESGAPERAEDVPTDNPPSKRNEEDEATEQARNRPRRPKHVEGTAELGTEPKHASQGGPLGGATRASLAVSPVFRGQHAAPVVALAASPKRGMIAVGGQLQVLIYETSTRSLVGVLPFPEGEVSRLTFCADGSALLAAGGTPAESGKAVLWDLDSGRRLGEYGDEYDVVMAADISPDRSFVVLGGQDRQGKLMDAATGRVLSTITKHTDWILEASFSPEGLIYATADRAGNVYVWETDGSHDLHTLRGHRGAVTAIDWAASGDACITAGEDGSLRVWDMHTGKQQKQWNAHPDGVLAVDLGPEDTLFTVGRDNMLRRWTYEGELIGELKLDALPLQVAALDRDTAVVGLRSGQAVLCAMNEQAILAQLEVPAELRTNDLARIDQTVVSPPMEKPQIASMPTPTPKAPASSAEIDGTVAGVVEAQQRISRIANQMEDTVALLKQSRESIAKYESEAERLESQLDVFESAAAEAKPQRLASKEAGERVNASLEARDQVARLVSTVDALARVESLARQTSNMGRNEQDALALVRIAREKAEAALEEARQSQQQIDAEMAEEADTAPSPAAPAKSSELVRVEEALSRARAELQKSIAEWQESQQTLAELQAALADAQEDLQQSATKVKAIGAEFDATQGDRDPAGPAISLSR